MPCDESCEMTDRPCLPKPNMPSTALSGLVRSPVCDVLQLWWKQQTKLWQDQSKLYWVNRGHVAETKENRQQHNWNRVKEDCSKTRGNILFRIKSVLPEINRICSSKQNYKTSAEIQASKIQMKENLLTQRQLVQKNSKLMNCSLLSRNTSNLIGNIPMSHCHLHTGKCIHIDSGSNRQNPKIVLPTNNVDQNRKLERPLMNWKDRRTQDESVTQGGKLTWSAQDRSIWVHPLKNRIQVENETFN